MNAIFDSHAHYTADRFDPDREKLLASLPGKNVKGVICVGDGLESSLQAAQLSARYPYLYASAGIHPHEAASAPLEFEQKLVEIVKKYPKVKAVGEIGLDYHYDFSPREKQLEVFERQLVLAASLSMPVIIHDREAHADTMALLKKYKPKGVVHCYSGSAQMAKEIVELGLFLGFTGVVTFANARRPLEALQVIPPDRILIETDCPYMAPVPFRGKRCDSSMLAYTAQAIADVKKMPVEELLSITFQNTCDLFGIDCQELLG